jgi:50S ribosomal subunit-associated GTPase HflX
MERHYSSRTLVSNGKLREIAGARVNSHAGAVVFFNDLTARQRTVLAEALGCPVFSRTDLQHLASSHHHENRPADPKRSTEDNGSC